MKHRTTKTHLLCRRSVGLLAAGLAPFLHAAPVLAQSTISLPPISVGAGLRTSFTATDSDAQFAGGEADEVNDFNIDSVRLYLSGSATDKIKLTFNTEFTGAGRSIPILVTDGPDADLAPDTAFITVDENKVQVLDAIARFEFSPMLNIWAGRFLPPSDRANLYGPYYANHWGVYIDGIQDGYPFVATGRSNGAAVWGDFGKAKISAGLFDVPSTTGDADPATGNDGGDVIFAARAQYNFLDAEPGYYLNGTYYGDKDLLSVGVALQTSSGDDALTVDVLFEKKLGNAGVITVEAEYGSYDGLGGYGFYGATESDGGYGLVSYLFPQVIGIGKIQVLGKFATVTNDIVGGSDLDKETTEIDLGYIMKAFNARAYLFYIDNNFDDTAGGPADSEQLGIGIQVQI